MSAKDSELQAVRRDIDAIDDQIHDLIMARTKIVERVRDLKKGEDIKIRPAREAEILYRLMKRHSGNFPKRELVRIWREMIVATLVFEGPFSVAVFAPEHIGGYWQLARNQYGSFTSMTGHASVRRVIETVRSGDATVGVLPFPFQGDQDPWWRHLVSTAADVPKVIARLPFAPPAATSAHQIEAVAIAKVKQYPSGRDRSYLVIDGGEPVGIQRLSAVCKDIGLSPIAVHDWHDQQRPEIWMNMIEVDDFVAQDDPRVGRLTERMEEVHLRVVQIGGYALPLGDEDFTQ